MMHLTRTGAFLRAARCSRLTPCRVRHVSAHRQFSSDSSHLSSNSNHTNDLNPVQNDLNAHSIIDKLARTVTGQSAKPQHATPADPAETEPVQSTPSKQILGQTYPSDNTTNITDAIISLVGRKLYDNPNHPIAITRALVESVFSAPSFNNHIASSPIVSTYDNFDILGFPKDHPGRSKTDTYYVSSSTVLRTHSSAHQHAAFQALSSPESSTSGYTICADVYRRDSIDRTHFPIFHQMEGALTWPLPPVSKPNETRLERQQRRTRTIRDSLKKFPEHNMIVSDPSGHSHAKTNPVQLEHDEEESELVAAHLKKSLEELVFRVFTAAQLARASTGKTGSSEKLQVRWVEAYFPFTSPSFELEVYWQGEWLELLGSGVVKQKILNNAGLEDRIAWAWGIGLERLAMILFEIPDIRLFWSEDERFLKQFEKGKISRFVPYSKYPPSPRDVSFWVRGGMAPATPLIEQSGSAVAAGGDARKAVPGEAEDKAFHENDFMEIVRDVAGSLVEDVKLVDEFVHPRTGKKSLCYRVVYRSHDRTLEGVEVNALHEKILEKVKSLPVEIR